MPDWVFIDKVIFPLIGMGMGTLAMVGIYRTINRVLERRHERQLALMRGSASPEVQRLNERLDAVEDHVARLGELEERIDFTERLLSRQREKDDLAPGR
jgi:hypothetical protein